MVCVMMDVWVLCHSNVGVGDICIIQHCDIWVMCVLYSMFGCVTFKRGYGLGVGFIQCACYIQIVCIIQIAMYG